MKRIQPRFSDLVWRVAAVVLLCAWPGLRAQQPRPLSLKAAIGMALSENGNARVQLSAETVEQARAAAARSRSTLLPHLDGTIGETDQTRNLEALGLRPDGQFRPPTLVGPFTTFDARASLSQTLFDFPSIRRYQAAKRGIEAAREDDQQNRELVAAQVAQLYLNAVRAGSAVEAAEADVKLAQEVLDLSTRQKEAGTGTRIEETRSQVQLANQRQRLFAATLEAGRAKLELARAIGLDLDERLELVDRLREREPSADSFEQASRVALSSRRDLRALEEDLRRSQLLDSAARLERAPSVAGFADYGSIGASPTDLIPTWAAGVTVQLPVFDGGKMEADRAEAKSKLRQSRIKVEDLKRQIELEVRLALSGVRLTREQVGVSERGLELAQDELSQAERRYQAGFTTGVEVTDAQERLERARQNHIAALYTYNIAVLNLSQAMGTVRQDFQ